MDQIIPEKVEGVRFTNRPIPVPYNYRIIYKLAQIALIIHYCSARKACSLEKIHIIATALSSSSELEKLLNYIEDNKKSMILVRFDPAINRAIDFALAEELILRQKNGLFKLSKKGKSYINEIVNDSDLFILEKSSLKRIELKLTEEKVNNLLSIWGG